MKRIALTTAIALSFAAPAFASDQLAASLGVDAGAYTTAELIELRTATENNDQPRIDYILSGTDNGAGDVTAIQLAVAEENDEHIFASFLRDGGSEVVSTQSFGGSDAGAQLAASLGVNSGDYTVAELIQLRSALESDEHAQVRAILN